MAAGQPGGTVGLAPLRHLGMLAGWVKLHHRDHQRAQFIQRRTFLGLDYSGPGRTLLRVFSRQNTLAYDFRPGGERGAGIALPQTSKK